MLAAADIRRWDAKAAAAALAAAGRAHEELVKPVVNVVFAGLGGQGVVKASDILADAAFRAGHDVKKAEVHGMSQRGGSVDLRRAVRRRGPLADGAARRGRLRRRARASRRRTRSGRCCGPAACCSSPDSCRRRALPNARSLNVALLGALSTWLDLPDEAWEAALAAALPRACTR